MKGCTRRALGLAILLAILAIAAVWVFNASQPGERVEGCPAGCATAARDSGEALRILSLNALHGHPHFENLNERLDHIAAEIVRLEADIVCLQEVPWTRDLGSGALYLSRVTGLNYVYLRANGNHKMIFFEEGSAILSRYPLAESSFIELEPQAGFFEHRIALHAKAVTPWGAIDIFVTHLTNGEAQTNRQQALALLDFVEASRDGFALIAGDFNARQDSPQIQALAQAWEDAYRLANPGQAGPTCCIDDLRAGPDEPLEKRIDYIFMAPGEIPIFELQSVQPVLNQPFETDTGWLWPSDHIGLLAVLRPVE